MTGSLPFIINQVKDFLFDGKDVPDNLLIELIFTWARTKNVVHRLAPDEYHGTIIKALPDGDFLKRHLLVEGPFRGRQCEHSDVMPDSRSPGVQLLNTVIQQLYAAFDGNGNPTEDDIDAILQQIPSYEMDGTYIAPQTDDLAAAFETKYGELVTQHTPRTLYYVEKCQIEAIQGSDLYRQEFEPAAKLEIGNFVTFYKTVSGLTFMVTGSFFAAFGMNTQMMVRIQLIQALLVFQYIAGAIGLTNDAHPSFLQFQQSMEGYLGSLETALQSPNPVWPRDSAHNTLPEGYLVCGMKHVKTVADNIGLNINDYLYIQLRMLENGRLAEFMSILELRGIHLDEDEIDWDAPVPSFPNFQCPGLPGTPKFAPQTCQYILKEEGSRFCLYGASLEREHRVLPDRFVCLGCHRLMEHRERDVLENLDDRTPELQLRLEFLESRKTNEHRNHQIQVRGRAVVKQTERGRARRSHNLPQMQSKRAKTLQYNFLTGYQIRGHSMKDPNLTGNRDYRAHGQLPNVLKAMLLVIFQCYPLQMQGGAQYCLGDKTLMEYMIRVLDAVGRQYGVDEPLKDGRLMYRKPGFDLAFNAVLEPIPGVKVWRVKPRYVDFVTQGTRPHWYNKKVRTEIRPELVRIAGDPLRITPILQALQVYEINNP